jgi:putative phosphoribosyl transferase
MLKMAINELEKVFFASPPRTPEKIPIFANRKEAGRKLGWALEKYKWQGPLILAIPPGGVEVGLEVAKYLNADFSVVLSRKLPLPNDPNTGFGAIAEDGSTYLHVNLAWKLAPELVTMIKGEQLQEIQRTAEVLRSRRNLPEISGRTVILISDGLARGSTMKAAFLLCRKRHPAKIIVAVPVSWKKAVEEIKWVADEVIALESPESFQEVAKAYDNWSAVSDEEVFNILAQWENLRRPRLPLVKKKEE